MIYTLRIKGFQKDSAAEPIGEPFLVLDSPFFLRVYDCVLNVLILFLGMETS